jgi:hypothetical protein
MKNHGRRDFLKVAGATTAAVGLFPRRAYAAPVWGDVPASIWPTPPDLKVLEIHLLGGVAPFESFYYRPPLGLRTRGFDSEIGGLTWNGVCAGTPVGLETQTPFFANDSNTKEIRLGPFAKPLWRADIRDRMRVMVVSHNLLPHEAAIPYALTGLRLGNPNQASLGAAIAHRYVALDLEAGPPRPLPYAYGLLAETAGLNSLLVANMSAGGRHPGAGRPLVLKIGPGFATFITQLQRTNMSSLKDALLDQHRGQYRDWLRFLGSGPPTRSSAFRDYDTSVTSLFTAPSLTTLLGTVPTSIPTNQECAHEPATTFEMQPNPTKTALQPAAFLLTRPVASERARYVCVIDSGIEPRVGLPYDVHNAGHPGDTGSNLWNVFQTLADLINDPALPADPNKLNLSDTLIIISTEFGRTPFKSQFNAPDVSSVGRDHWPQAYVNVLIGGPITTRAVIGSINDGANELGVADVSYTPTDVRAAALVACGINPFESENFAIGQLSVPFGTAATHEQGMELLRTQLLGVGERRGREEESPRDPGTGRRRSSHGTSVLGFQLWPLPPHRLAGDAGNESFARRVVPLVYDRK